MPVSLRRGRVTAVVEEQPGLVRLEVDGAPCVAYPGLTGPVEVGDEVLVNVQARELGLGSGGFDVLHANLTRGLELPVSEGAHVMKLPYTPLQFAAPHGEEAGVLAADLDGLPVLCCSLHSQLAPACAGLGEGLEVAYVQLPGGALPLPLSDTVRALRGRGLIATTVSAGACFGGDVECVGVESALAWSAGGGYPGGRLLDRPGDRRHRLPARARRPGGGGGGQRRRRSRRLAGAGGAGLERGRARAAPRRLAPHGGGPPALRLGSGRRVAGRARGAGLGRAAARGGRRRLGRRLRGPTALAHGPRPGRGALVLRRRLRRRAPGSKPRQLTTAPGRAAPLRSLGPGGHQPPPHCERNRERRACLSRDRDECVTSHRTLSRSANPPQARVSRP